MNKRFSCSIGRRADEYCTIVDGISELFDDIASLEAKVRSIIELVEFVYDDSNEHYKKMEKLRIHDFSKK